MHLFNGNRIGGVRDGWAQNIFVVHTNNDRMGTAMTHGILLNRFSSKNCANRFIICQVLVKYF
ncbi:hypothetical protein DESC_10035 [Desulfosarcina cetonica]|nr:hypothetical protein DESC_10035 [Desulfosarcina cetonica]